MRQDLPLNGSLLVFGLIAIFCACLLGATPLSFTETLGGLFRTGEIEHQLIVWEIRLPRALSAFAVALRSPCPVPRYRAF